VSTITMCVVRNALGARSPPNAYVGRTAADANSDTRLDCRPESQPDRIRVDCPFVLSCDLDNAKGFEGDAEGPRGEERDDCVALAAGDLKVPDYSDWEDHYCTGQ
jgi:hypothetical protein